MRPATIERGRKRHAPDRTTSRFHSDGIRPCRVVGLRYPADRAATGQPHRFTVDYAALGGRTSELNHWIALNGDCSVAGYYSVRIVTPPQHGQARVDRGRFYPRFGRLDARAGCDASRHDGVALSYTPSSGYSGPDHLAISVIAPDGAYWSTDFNIVVPLVSTETMPAAATD